MQDIQGIAIILILVFIGLFLFGSFMLVLILVWRRYLKLSRVNCLYWRHADNTADGNDRLELLRVPGEQEFIKQYFTLKHWPMNKNYYKTSKSGRPKKHGLTEVTLKDRLEIAKKEYTKVDIIPTNAPTWNYKETWWQLWNVLVHWVYEKKVVDEGTGVISYNVAIFNPDEHLDTSVTSTELAKSIDWTESKEVYQYKSTLLEKVAYAAPVLLGLASIGAVFMLSVFLMGGKG